jgi:hypothetical protein
MHTAVISHAAGRRVTPAAIRPHSPGPRRARRRPVNGSRPALIRSPSSASVAGSTVSEPRTAKKTTMIVPSAIAVNTLSPVMSRPASESMTVRPETTIARPAVAAAMSSAASGPRPARRSSRSRRT